MSFLSFERVTALPQTLKPSCMYILKSSEADLVELYVTNSTGTEIRHVLNKGDVNAMITSAVASSVSTLSDVKIVSNIAARDALSLTANTFVLVLDATADSTVTAGAAMYVYNKDNSQWSKVYEAESLDLELVWTSIQGRPTASAADIDLAVSQSHVHLNKAVLDELSDDGAGNIQYQSKYPKTPLEKVEW